MYSLLLKIENTIDAISAKEFGKNPEACAKAIKIEQMIAELKHYQNNQGVLKYIDTKMLLEN